MRGAATAVGALVGASAVLSGVASAAPATQPDAGSTAARRSSYAEQGARAAATAGPVTRQEIMRRAQVWVDAEVPYSTSRYWKDGYRQDCSGFLSMAWRLGGSEWTGSLAAFGERISKSELAPGDMLLRHDPADPGAGSHVVLFGGWLDAARTRYTAYEQTRPHTIARGTPYAYWNNADGYVAYRHKGLDRGGDDGDRGREPSEADYPGRGSFGAGADNRHVTRLGEMLVRRGAGSYYTSGPGPRWGDVDRRATRAFQRAQGWTGPDADGLPGPATWKLLVTGGGKDIGPGEGRGSGRGDGGPAYPGADAFGPGRSNAHVQRLGERLVERGHGRHYTRGPGPRWSDSDRRGVRDFQLAQGWNGADADGLPGRETWRRLFS
ncbi:peptidoglycan-binding protein [Streptomyces sp. NPDC059917]|uniref:peptidoglycan-binding protein n=1 Tax=Streptomyces sp. NPDC059917 TaxID=3347002 RepID=UPI003651210A